MKYIFCLFVMGMFTTGVWAANEPSPQTRPNILVILSDDQGYADVGFQGCKDVPTPHLDQLAREGLRCTNGYVSHPYCSPSRAGLMTGRYQMRFGHELNPFYDPSNHREGLPLTEKLLPEYLQEAGYTTGWIGKWHLGAAPEFWPEKRGFQETFGFIGGGHLYQNWKVNPSAEYNVPICRNGKPVDVKEHLTLAFGHEAGAFIKRHTDKPWFLYLAFNAPHTPNQPTPERLAKFSHIKNKQRAEYLAQISLMDDAIGETLAALRQTGQAGRTLVFFFSDNGGARFPGVYDNSPLRGTKGTTYEGGVRVPFVVSWPGKLPAGKDYSGTVVSLDVFATALACAGVPMPKDKPHDGVNLLPFLSGQDSGTPHQRLFWRELEWGQWGMRDGDLKLVRRTREVGVRHGQWYSEPLSRPSDELFNLAADIRESQNIAADRNADLQRLKIELNEWEKLGAPRAFTGIKGKEPEPPATQPRAGNNTTHKVDQLPTPTAAQLAWQQAEFGVMFHFDPRIYNSGNQNLQPACRSPLKNPAEYANKFNPTALDTDQWAATARAAGATFAILVVKHETGFCLWQSDANRFSLKNIAWRDGKADILRDFIASCKKYGIKPGIFTEARWNLQYGVYDHKVGRQSPLTQAEYNRLIEREVEELSTRYGELFEIWWDGGIRTPSQGGPDVLPIIEKHQPRIHFYHSAQRADSRWGATESGTVAYPCWATTQRHVIWGDKPSKESHRLSRSGDPNAKDWCPAMSDTPLRCENGIHQWIWAPGTEKGIASLASLQNKYYGSVGRNSTLIIGLTPDRTGLLPPLDVARCKEFGNWLEKTFGGKPLAETSGQAVELTLQIPADNKTPVTHIILQEQIKDGERVREYVVEALVNGSWKQVCQGSCIGHKRIETIAPCTARQFRLKITKSIADPSIRSFSLR